MSVRRLQVRIRKSSKDLIIVYSIQKCLVLLTLSNIAWPILTLVSLYLGWSPGLMSFLFKKFVVQTLKITRSSGSCEVPHTEIIHNWWNFEIAVIWTSKTWFRDNMQQLTWAVLTCQSKAKLLPWSKPKPVTGGSQVFGLPDTVVLG